MPETRLSLLSRDMYVSKAFQSTSFSARRKKGARCCSSSDTPVHAAKNQMQEHKKQYARSRGRWADDVPKGSLDYHRSRGVHICFRLLLGNAIRSTYRSEKTAVFNSHERQPTGRQAAHPFHNTTSRLPDLPPRRASHPSRRGREVGPFPRPGCVAGL